MEKIYSEFIGIPHDKKDLSNWSLDHAAYAELMEQVDTELLSSREALKDFVGDILKEQPDVLVFLDKGARMFGTPVKKYLEELNAPKMPEIVFYNDDYLKWCYQNGTLLDNSIIEDNIGHLAGKKVFFLDETMAEGEGAATLKMVKDCREGFEGIHYFALSYWNPFEVERSPDTHHGQMLERIRDDKNFKIHYENRIKSMFSHDWSDLYVRDVFDHVKEVVRTQHKSARKDAYGSKSDLDKSKHVLNFKTVADIKRKILATLRSLDLPEEKS